MAPTERQIHASIDKMYSSAREWHSTSEHIDNARAQIEPLKFSRVAAGVFQIAYQAYINTATFMEARLVEGASEAESAASTLKICAETYQREEDDSVHALTGLY